MSFAETFDYAPVVTGLNAEKAANAASQVKLTAERDALLAAAPYATQPEVIQRLSRLTGELERAVEQAAAIDAVLAEIVVLLALDDAKKADLYYFYSVVEASKQDFMAKMLFNHSAALNDGKIAALRADTVTAPEARAVIAKLYYSNYALKQEWLSALMSVFRYVR